MARIKKVRIAVGKKVPVLSMAKDSKALATRVQRAIS
jgi:hypothetical protein